MIVAVVPSSQYSSSSSSKSSFLSFTTLLFGTWWLVKIIWLSYSDNNRYCIGCVLFCFRLLVFTLEVVSLFCLRMYVCFRTLNIAHFNKTGDSSIQPFLPAQMGSSINMAQPWIGGYLSWLEISVGPGRCLGPSEPCSERRHPGDAEGPSLNQTSRRGSAERLATSTDTPRILPITTVILYWSRCISN